MLGTRFSFSGSSNLTDFLTVALAAVDAVAAMAPRVRMAFFRGIAGAVGSSETWVAVVFLGRPLVDFTGAGSSVGTAFVASSTVFLGRPRVARVGGTAVVSSLSTVLLDRPRVVLLVFMAVLDVCSPSSSSSEVVSNELAFRFVETDLVVGAWAALAFDAVVDFAVAFCRAAARERVILLGGDAVSMASTERRIDEVGGCSFGQLMECSGSRGKKNSKEKTTKLGSEWIIEHKRKVIPGGQDK